MAARRRGGALGSGLHSAARWRLPPASRPNLPALLALPLLVLLACGHGSLASVLGGVDLTNFQQEHGCDNTTVLIVRPRTIADIQAAVLLHDTVKASGAGHSWNQPFACAGAEPQPALATSDPAPSRLADAAAPPRRPTAANIALTTLRPLSIDVDAADASVWVDAPVILADLLEYLANHVTPDAPAGWTLPAFPWFVYQTIGGAVATGSHGSSMAYGSLSSEHQLLGLEVVLADGSLRRFNPRDDPFLFKALRVSVGRLGVITRVHLRIVREVPVRRTLTPLTPPAFLEGLRALQEAARAGGSALAAAINETEFFWISQKYQFLRVSYDRADTDANLSAVASAASPFRPDNTTVFQVAPSKAGFLALGELTLPADAVLSGQGGPQVVEGGERDRLVALQPRGHAGDRASVYPTAAGVLADLDAAINAPLPAGGISNSSDPAVGDAWALPEHNRPSAFYASANMADGALEASRIGIFRIAGNSTIESTSAYIKQPNSTLGQLRRILYDQYEVSFPLTTAADCWAAVLDTAYGADLLGQDRANRTSDKGFRTAPLIRIVGAEEGLLSHTHDGPRMFVNIEDYLYYNQGRVPNLKFRAIMATLRADPRCTAAGPTRLHWGKAGWPDPGCWRGDEVFGDNWCRFGCAARELDPTGKFSDSAPDRWTWAGLDLERCCGADGFDSSKEGCACRVRHPRTDCPPAPFYTNR